MNRLVDLFRAKFIFCRLKETKNFSKNFGFNAPHHLDMVRSYQRYVYYISLCSYKLIGTMFNIIRHFFSSFKFDECLIDNLIKD